MPPVPKRRAELLGHRSKAEMNGVDRVVVDGPVSVPGIRKSLHPIARRWYRALQRSGQAQFFEPSDWALAVFVAEGMDRALNGGLGWVNAFKMVIEGSRELLTTEAARRRVRVEVERTPATGKGAKPREVRDYRSRLIVHAGGAAPRPEPEAPERSDPDRADGGTAAE